jgi:hypothetical protein
MAEWRHGVGEENVEFGRRMGDGVVVEFVWVADGSGEARGPGEISGYLRIVI